MSKNLSRSSTFNPKYLPASASRLRAGGMAGDALFAPGFQDPRDRFCSFRSLSRTVCCHGKFVALLAGSSLLAVGTLRAANDAWSTTPANNTFTGINWTLGTTTPGAPTGTIAAGDSLYFGTSSITTLNDDEVAGFSLAGLTFNAGAPAYTIGGNSLTLTGNITNSGTTNLQTINDALTYTAGTTFSTAAGGLTLGGNITATGTGAVTLAGGGGTVTLGGTDTFTNTAGSPQEQVVGGSTLNITGSTTVTLTGGGYFALGQGGAGAGAITIAAGGNFTLAGTGNFFNGTFGGGNGTVNINGTLTSTATAQFRLGYSAVSTTNLNSGGVFITGSALTIGNVAANSVATFNFNGGTLRPSANNLTLFGGNPTITTITSSSSASTIDANSFASTVALPIVNGAATGGMTIIDSSLAKTGSVTLSAANTYTGTTSVNSGTLSLTGSLSASSSLALGGGTFNYNPTVANSTQTVTGTTINVGGSTLNVTAGNTLALGTVTHNAGGVLGFGAGTGTITTSAGSGANGILGPYAYVNTGTNLSYVTSGTIAAYTGGTTAPTAASVTDATGTVNYNVAAGGAVGAGASANTLRYTGAADTITGPVTLNGLMNAGTGALTVNGTVTSGSTNELVVLSNGQNITLNGALGNNGANAVALTYGGPTAGTLTLNGASAYTGATTVTGGTLTAGVATVVGTSGAFGVNSAVTLANVAGTGINLNNFNTQIGSLSGGGSTGGNVALGSATLTVGADNTSPAAYSGVISGTGALTKIGTGTEIFTNNSTYTGATVINGGTLTLTGGGNSTGALAGTPTITVNSGGTLVLTNGDTLGYTAGKEALVINSGGQVLNNGVGVRDTLQNTLTMTGGILGAAASAGDGNGAYSFDVTTVGTNTVLATSDAGGTAALINAPKVLLQTANEIFNVTRGAATPTSDLIISSVIAGNNTFTKIGNGVLSLTGANTYSGTVVNAGTLTGSGTSPLGAITGALAVNNPNTTAPGTATVLNLSTTAATTTGSLSGTISTPTSGTNTATINNGGQRFMVNQTAAGTFAGVIAGLGGLTLGATSTNTLTLTGFNTYSGGTIVNAGTLALGAGGGTGAIQGVVTVNSGATLNLTTGNALGYTAGSQVTTLNINGGTVNTTSALGDEGFITSFNLTGGTLAYTGTNATNGYQIAAADATAPGITSNASATVSLISGNVNIRSGTLPIAVAKGTTASGVDLQVTGAISGTGFGVTKTGVGLLSLGGANTFSGATTVNAGTLSLDNNNATTARLANTSGIAVNAGGTLLLAQSGATTSTDRIKDAAPVNLGASATANGGGIFNTGGLNEGPVGGAAGSAAAVGALTLGSNSTIDFMTGTTAAGSNLLFASLTYTAGTVVSIKDFTGTAGADSGTAGNDRLLFITNPNLTDAQLASITFYNDVGTAFAAGATEFSFNGYTELVPVAVPEPATWIGGLLLAGILAACRAFPTRAM